MKKNTYVIKKDGTLEKFNIEKIVNAVSKSSWRLLHKMSDEEIEKLKLCVIDLINEYEKKELKDGEDSLHISISTMHSIVEMSLDQIDPKIAKSYREYRDYKTSFVHMLDDVYKKSQSIMYIGDRENANTDSALVSTKRSLIFNQLNKELYQKFQMDTETLQACRDGYIYVHDMSARRDTMNCCIFDIVNVLEGGFEMGNVWYNEPKSLDTAFDVMGDIILSAASQQYGGFTIARVDEILKKYAEMSYDKYRQEIFDYKTEIFDGLENVPDDLIQTIKIQSIKEAKKKVERDFMQGFQGWEYKFNTVASSRGDYPFITITIGLGTSMLEKMASKCCLRVRKGGQGKEGHKKHVLFPKIVFTYTEDLHGVGKPNEDVFEEGIQCSSKAMYPDWLSLDGDTTLSEMWHKYGEVIAPMGCVSGDSTIKVKKPGDEYGFITDFETLWKTLTDPSSGNKAQVQPGRIRDMYLDPKDLLIYDLNADDYVKVKRVIRNVSDKWIRITLRGTRRISDTKTLICTPDHPLPIIDKERTFADHVKEGDKIKGLTFDLEEEVFEVIELQKFDKLTYSYDVTTESDRFMVNGLDSHNCRAFLSPYYERGGVSPADENDRPFFTGRFNIGAVSLNLPMILMKSRKENKDFYEVLDYYLELIRRTHKMTYDYLGEMRASCNPLAYCEGGFHDGYLKPTDKIRPLLHYTTASFGVTALNELNRLYNGKSILEDGEFPLEVMNYIANVKLPQFKKEDHINYAVYGTPAESLCSTQVTQFRQKYGIIKDVSDRGYVSNSFHCHVSEDIDGITKQDKELRFWNLFTGGRIQYVKYGVDYNLDAMRTYIRRAMKLGLYEGVNLVLSYCEDCGHSENGMDVCPVCGSKNICKIERMNGYLAYSRVHGATRLNDGKMEEIADRKSM